MRHKIYIIVAVMVIVGAFFLWKFWPSGSVSLPPPELGELQIYQPKADENFIFSYPKKFNVTEVAIEGIENGKRILVEAEGEKMGFEMTILPFDEPGPLTEARLRLDLPDMVMENISNISVSNNIPAISFDSIDENIGETHEVWFVNNGFLYQALTYPEFGTAMEAILQTWHFK